MDALKVGRLAHNLQDIESVIRMMETYHIQSQPKRCFAHQNADRFNMNLFVDQRRVSHLFYKTECYHVFCSVKSEHNFNYTQTNRLLACPMRICIDKTLLTMNICMTIAM